jgi:hypothetical protein
MNNTEALQPTPEQAQRIKGKIEAHFIGDQISVTIEAGMGLLAAVMAQKHKFETMGDVERVLLAGEIEQLGKCCYLLGSHLRGKGIQ